MSILKIIDEQGNRNGEVDVSKFKTDQNCGSQVLQNFIVGYRANQRGGNHSTLTKGEVAGNGKKPWRQKGTGRARAGYRQSPIWRGGGVVFGPKPRDYSKKMNKKSCGHALRQAVAAKIMNHQISIFQRIEIESAKSRDLISILQKFKIDGGLIVVGKQSKQLSLASRNMSRVVVKTSMSVNAYDIVRASQLSVTLEAFKELERRVVKSQTEAI